MPLRLSIENMTALPDGGPVSVTIAGKRGIDIGRDQYLDWVLPDPNRVVSGKHAEIRYQDGAYWLRDLSTNGTFVNQNPRRLTEPHRLRHGDRVEIGSYIIRVDIEGEEAGVPEDAGAAPASGAGLWTATDSAPPIDPVSLRPPPQPHPLLAADPLDWLAQLPSPIPPPPPPAPLAPAAPPDDLWGLGEAARPEPFAPAVPPVPPRRSTQPLPEAVEARPAAAYAPTPVAPPALPPVPQAPPVAVTVAAPTPQRVPPVPSGEANAEFIRRFAEGAGLEPSAIAFRDAGDLAEQLGVLMQVCAANVGQLLAARAQAKSAMRSTQQTMIQLQGNNPLRFAPTPQDALALLFGRPTPSYLDAGNAFERSFQTLKQHEIDIFSAIQEAIQDVLGDLDPAVIERVAGAEGKKGGLFGNDRAVKARLWDEFAARWKVKTGAHDSGMFGAFMRVFGQAYDKKGD